MSLSAAVCPRKRAHSRELDRERKHEQEMSLSASVMVRGASRFFSYSRFAVLCFTFVLRVWPRGSVVHAQNWRT